MVNSNSVALLALVLLSNEILSVDGTHDIETVTVVSSNEDKSVVKLANLVKVFDSGANSVIKLKKLTKSTLIIYAIISTMLLALSSYGRTHQARASSCRLMQPPT